MWTNVGLLFGIFLLTSMMIRSINGQHAINSQSAFQMHSQVTEDNEAPLEATVLVTHNSSDKAHCAMLCQVTDGCNAVGVVPKNAGHIYARGSSVCEVYRVSQRYVNHTDSVPIYTIHIQEFGKNYCIVLYTVCALT